MELNYKRKELLQKGLCNHCLGRQFAQLGSGLENYQRGYLLRNNYDLSPADFKQENVPEDLEPGGECDCCEGYFNQLNKYSDLMVDKLKEYSFNTILVGTRPPASIKKKEEELWAEYGSQEAEKFKQEFNRLLAKRIMPKLNVESDLKHPDIQAVIDLVTDKVELHVGPVFIYGQYNKYVRYLSQTIWNYSQSSIQQVIQPLFLQRFAAVESKFHGAGREDLDVRCFGKREFVLELVSPKHRKADLEQLARELNAEQDQVEIFNLQFVGPEQKRVIKEKNADKIYKALVQLDQEIAEQSLISLNEFPTVIEQKTPGRVLKTRADKLRTRKVYQVAAEIITSQKIELVIKAEAGTYIKEFISGDQGRTEPSVAGLLGCQAQCKRLDVLDIDN